MKLKKEKVEPGVGIGEFKINMLKEEVLEKIGFRHIYQSECFLQIKNADFLLDHNNKVYKITVYKGFKGRFIDKIGIGTMLADIQKYAGEYYQIGNVLELRNYPGICFELSVNNQDKTKSKVQAITISRVEKKFTEGNVEPGVGIGELKINMSKRELLKKIGSFYKIQPENIIEVGNAKFWLDESDKIYKIAVLSGFEGKFMNYIGIGSTLEDVQKYAGNYFEDYGAYGLEEFKGISFELGEYGDADCYDEMKAPINAIVVFKEEF